VSTKLSETNPYLRDPGVRKSMVIKSVVTSSAIEGIRASYMESRKRVGKASGRKSRVSRKKSAP
jgi:hypothetical protein